MAVNPKFSRSGEQFLYDRGDMLANIVPLLQTIAASVSGGSSGGGAEIVDAGQIAALSSDANWTDYYGNSPTTIGGLYTGAVLPWVASSYVYNGIHVYRILNVNGVPKPFRIQILFP